MQRVVGIHQRAGSALKAFGVFQVVQVGLQAAQQGERQRMARRVRTGCSAFQISIAGAKRVVELIQAAVRIHSHSIGLAVFKIDALRRRLRAQEFECRCKRPGVDPLLCFDDRAGDQPFALATLHEQSPRLAQRAVSGRSVALPGAGPGHQHQAAGARCSVVAGSPDGFVGQRAKADATPVSLKPPALVQFSQGLWHGGGGRGRES